MNYRYLFLIVAVHALSPLARGAEPVTYTFECDTPAAHWSDWTRTVSVFGVHAAGKITLNEIRDDPKWMPGAGIAVHGKQDGKDAVAGIQLASSKQAPDKIFVTIVAPDDKQPKLLGTLPATTTEFRFDLKLDAKGLLQVSLGGQRGSRQLKGFHPATLALNCSTGDFEFTGIEIDDAAE